MRTIAQDVATPGGADGKRAFTYAEARSGPVRSCVGVSCGDGRHALALHTDPVAVPQRRLNAAKGCGKPPAAADLAAVAAWLDRHLEVSWVQGVLWEDAA